MPDLGQEVIPQSRNLVPMEMNVQETAVGGRTLTIKPGSLG